MFITWLFSSVPLIVKINTIKLVLNALAMQHSLISGANLSLCEKSTRLPG